MEYISPKLGSDGFNCPHCGAYAHQKWSRILLIPHTFLAPISVAIGTMNSEPTSIPVRNFFASTCLKCGKVALWFKDNMIYPNMSTAPLFSPDMPEDVVTIYEEARQVMQFSPRASAALLRLAVEKLMPHLDAQGNNLNEKIGDLVKKGLDIEIQESLDSIRVIGNNAVHPGQISIDDDPNVALALFDILNIIIESTITRSKKIKAVHSLLPPGAKEAIKKRDAR